MSMLSAIVEWFDVPSVSELHLSSAKHVNARYNRRSVLSQYPDGTIDSEELALLRSRGDKAALKWLKK